MSRIKIASWNINSVRLRIDLVTAFLERMQPDVICLQETKCPDEAFPHEGIAGLGFTHRLVRGMKGSPGGQEVVNVRMFPGYRPNFSPKIGH